MKNNIQPEGFREILPSEQQMVNGGAFPFLLLIGAAAVTQIIIDWDNFKSGLMGRPETKKILPYES